jgi:hypothetical protein
MYYLWNPWKIVNFAEIYQPLFKMEADNVSQNDVGQREHQLDKVHYFTALT